MHDDRLTRIEMLLAHQEKQIEDLSEMTTAQWAEIDRLKRLLEVTHRQLTELQDSTRATKSDGAKSVAEFSALEKPPHY